MALTIYTPTAEEVEVALAEHINKNPMMMLVAVTDSEDPNWRGGDHVNFSMMNNGKAWILEGSNGKKYKMALKEIVEKPKKEKKVEAPAEPVAEPVTPEATEVIPNEPQ